MRNVVSLANERLYRDSGQTPQQKQSAEKRASAAMISRATLEHDPFERCYAGEIDWYGFPILIEVRQSWLKDKQALEVVLKAPTKP